MEGNEITQEERERQAAHYGNPLIRIAERCHKALITENLGDIQRMEEAKAKLKETYEKIIEFLKDWIVMKEESYVLIALWIIGTYFHDNFEAYPFIFFNAMRGSAKTRTLKILSHLVNKGDGSVLNSPSESALFRMAKKGALIIDECELIRKNSKETMRDILNSCYKRGAKVVRIKKVHENKEEKFQEEEHELYAPVAMANINGLEEVLEDRCILIPLEKSNDPYRTKKMENFSSNFELNNIKANLVSVGVQVGVCVGWLKTSPTAWNEWLFNKYTTLTYTHTHLHQPTPTDIIEEELFLKIDNADINGRNLELFFPLLVVANEIGIFEDILKIIKETNIKKRDDEFAESKDVALYEFISLADRYRFEYVFVHQLKDEFKNFLGEHFEEGKEVWLTNEWFSAALKRLALIGNRKRVAKGSMILPNVDKAKEKIKMFKAPEEKGGENDGKIKNS
jgi:hypothetical protein